MTSTFFFPSNIRHLRTNQKLSQDVMAKTLDISRVKLNALENGNTKNPTLDDLLRFSEYFGIGIDSMLKVDLSQLTPTKLGELQAGNDYYTTGTKLRVLATTVNSDNNDNIELVPVKAKAGYAAGYGDPDFIATLPVFSMPHLPQNRKYRMFPTTGDSMHPVPENAYVIGEYLEDWTSIKNETACIVITKNEGIVFKLATMKGKTMQLKSLNAIYTPYEVPVGEILEVWKFKNYIADALPEPETPIQEVARVLNEIKGILKQW